MSDRSGSLVVIETSAGEVRETSLEALTIARESGVDGPVTAVIIGHNVTAAAENISADRVLVVDHPDVERYTTAPYVACIEAAIAEVQPAVVVLGGSTAGRDLGPYLAARAGTNCMSGCTTLRWDGDALVGTRPVYQDKLLADVTVTSSSTAFAVMRSGVVEPLAAGTAGSVDTLAVEFDDSHKRVTLTNVSVPPAGAVDLEGAETIVAGGRGVGSEENFAMVEQLAAAVGGAVGATRAVTDLGWRPHYEQIGQTGKSVKPKLYFAVGISGAVQHTVGMQSSETVVAINRDPDAPIFKFSQIGIVGDLNEIVPALIAELESAKS